MASLSRKGAQKISPHMNVTPLVDVVLVLLIIFMVVIPAMEQGLNIEVPGIVHADDEEESSVDPFILSVAANGAMYFENSELLPERFEAFLRDANQREPQRRLVVRGDRTVRYERVRELLAIVQNIGFPGVSLRVNQRAGDAAAEATN
ncbi:MAG: biopolymer transporter ExbD [Polyangiaceae bacterium]|nr:biopolymer transporter ExbD [Polyangiaceae bacterium]